MNIIILAGSNRKNATSTRLGEYAVEVINGQGHEASLFDLYQTPLPFMHRMKNRMKIKICLI